MAKLSHWAGAPPFRVWFAWYPVRDEDENWIWWRYVRVEADGTVKRLPDDVD